MRLKPWNLLNSLLFGLGIYILIEPWINFFYSGLINYQQATWIILVLALTNFVTNFRKSPIIGVIIFAFFNILFIYWLDWPINFFAPLTLLLILIGLRFTYYNRVEFTNDFALGILVLLFNLMIGFEIGYGKIILFFLTGISLSVLLNANEVARKGYSRQYRFRVVLIVIFTLVVLVFSFLFGFSLQGPFFQRLLALMNWLYEIFLDLLMIILYPILWLLTPLMYLLKNIWLWLFSGDLSQKNKLPYKMPYLSFENNTIKKLVINPLLPKIIFCIVLSSLILYIVIRLREKDKSVVETGIIEERESIFSLSELQGDIKKMWTNFKARFSGSTAGRNIYDGSNPIIIIREIYYKFLLKFNLLVHFQIYYTPFEYLKHLRKSHFLAGEDVDLEELTVLYNQARYSQEANWEEVEKARLIWDKIKNLEKGRFS